MIEKMKCSVNWFNRFMGYLSGFGILAMGLILTYEVISRYFFNAPTIWASEVATYIFMWAMFSGLAYTLQQGKHVHIDLIVARLSETAQRWLHLITSVMGLAFSVVVSEQAWHIVMKAVKYKKFSPTPLHVPLWIPSTAFLVGFVFLSLQFGVIILDELQSLFGSRKEESAGC